MTLNRRAFTSGGTVSVPAGCSRLHFRLWGGGGGGGAGDIGSTTNDRSKAGGAGGAGALEIRGIKICVPGETLTVVVGTGGTTASNGVDSTITGSTSGLLATGLGGDGGGSAGLATSDATSIAVTFGGRPSFDASAPQAGIAIAGTELFLRTGMLGSEPSSGGNSFRDTVIVFGKSDGRPSPNGFTGGSAGTTGTDAGAKRGGTQGAGGGGGPGGAGGNGGNGGNGDGGGIGVAGTAGQSAAANTGAGGGGGGSGGYGVVGGAAGGAAGSGGSGFVEIWFEV